MNFLRFDPTTGAILEIGYMETKFIQQEIDDGKPTIIFDEYITRDGWRINIQTKQLEKVNQTIMATSETPDNNNVGAVSP